MKEILALMLILMSGCSTNPAPPIPISSGKYTFQHRFAEQPSIGSFALNAEIQGTHIVLTNSRASGPFPEGVLAEGELMWHATSGQWIISHQQSDRLLHDVGGCSDGPEVVDLVGKIYWTC